MFTGIIQAIGKIEAIDPKGGDVRLTVGSGKLPLDQVQLGDSIAVGGVCLTAVSLSERAFVADVSRETLGHTVLGEVRAGAAVNLELAMTPRTRFGGHIVSGHVDGVGIVTARWSDGRSVRFRIEAPSELARYIAAKGSICVDGISLTVNRVEGAAFEVNIVPHTLAETTLGATDKGARVNLEVDVIARYLERLVLGEKAAETGVDLELLKRSGFV
ncbi:riboflavin synthase [Methylohalobius crimeensis]|uniref:riboflavin synthase n=1 Tax=Methylohalobius crimeensis TaxID=244365 RepID=UPI0003B2EFE7|nr:riboflavin synthase [Methylohalobius crimeensis]